MGYMQALGFKNEVNNGLSEVIALQWHLQSNHYPPLPGQLVSVCQAAIDAANNGDWEVMIPMPAEILFRGRDTVSVSDAIESLHLDAFLDPYCF